MVGITGITSGNQTRVCEHRKNAAVWWINNDGITPPIIMVDGVTQSTVISMTNQVIRVSCPACFDLESRATPVS